MNRGMYCFLPITIMVIAKPSAGRILPAIAAIRRPGGKQVYKRGNGIRAIQAGDEYRYKTHRKG